MFIQSSCVNDKRVERMETSNQMFNSNQDSIVRTQASTLLNQLTKLPERTYFRLRLVCVRDSQIVS